LNWPNVLVPAQNLVGQAGEGREAIVKEVDTVSCHGTKQ
jgi:hypothetical protein